MMIGSDCALIVLVDDKKDWNPAPDHWKKVKTFITKKVKMSSTIYGQLSASYSPQLQCFMVYKQW